jgi:hypothetical protein
LLESKKAIKKIGLMSLGVFASDLESYLHDMRKAVWLATFAASGDRDTLGFLIGTISAQKIRSCCKKCQNTCENKYQRPGGFSRTWSCMTWLMCQRDQRIPASTVYQ